MGQDHLLHGLHFSLWSVKNVCLLVAKGLLVYWLLGAAAQCASSTFCIEGVTRKAARGCGLPV